MDHEPASINVENIYPIAVLIDELKHEDVTVRLNAIRRLSTIALALGTERARDELVTFIEESIDDEDEVLVALAEELGNLVDYIGGPPFAHILLSPLENLAAVEEPAVRDKAVESLNKLIPLLKLKQVEEYLIPLVRRLASGDWFTSRSSSAGLFAEAYHFSSPPTQEELRKLFSHLASDETPMVRRAVSIHLPVLVKKLTVQIVTDEIIPILTNLTQDDQDSVRLLAVDVFVAVAELIGQNATKTTLLGQLRNLYQDKSWRVRFIVADKFVHLAKSVGHDVIQSDLLPTFSSLLRDTEAEVKTASCGQLGGFAELVEADGVKKYFLAPVKDLVTDASQHVRAALATNVGSLSPILGKEGTIDNLLPLFLLLLKDEFPEVRLNIISRMDLVNKVIGIDLLAQSLLPAIMELAEDKQWRVRLAIIEHIPLLASQLGMDFFNEKLSHLCLSWLGDPVFSIREAATLNMKKLTEAFGHQWAKSFIVPKILEFTNHSNYLYRMTCIQSISILASVLPPEMVKDQLLGALIQLQTDPIPNIRFNVAKSMELLIPVLKKAEQTKVINEKIKTSLAKLNEDLDVDVRYYAQRALLAV